MKIDEHSDGVKRNIGEVIEDDVRHLKKCRYSEDKKKQYKIIVDGIKQFFKQTGMKSFRRSLIYSFIDDKIFPQSTMEKHQKAILSTLKENGIITDGEQNATTTQRRIYELKTNDFDGSYSALMWGNGFYRSDFFEWYCDSDGVPRKKKVGSCGINGLPVDENGDSVDEWDCSALIETIPRQNQGVFAYSNKSIAFEQRRYSRSCFKVII